MRTDEHQKLVDKWIAATGKMPDFSGNLVQLRASNRPSKPAFLF